MTEKKALALFLVLFFSHIPAGEALAKRFDNLAEKLHYELEWAGYRVLGYGKENSDRFIGVVLPVGSAIYEVCRSVPSLNRNYVASRERIAEFNGVNPFYKRSLSGKEPATMKLEFIKIPLDAVGSAVPATPEKPKKNTPPKHRLWRVYVS